MVLSTCICGCCRVHRSNERLLQAEIDRLVQVHIAELHDSQRSVAEQQYGLVNDSELSQGRGAPGMVGMVQRRGATESSTGTSDGDAHSSPSRGQQLPSERSLLTLQPAVSSADLVPGSDVAGDEATGGSSINSRTDTRRSSSWHEEQLERGISPHILKSTRDHRSHPGESSSVLLPGGELCRFSDSRCTCWHRVPRWVA